MSTRSPVGWLNQAAEGRTRDAALVATSSAPVNHGHYDLGHQMMPGRYSVTARADIDP
jgi:hypothetical protein